MIYIYMISAENLIGRKESTTSTVSTDEVFTRSTASDLAEDSCGDCTSLDYVHPILSEDDSGVRSASFTRILAPPPQTTGTGDCSGTGINGTVAGSSTGRRKGGVVSGKKSHKSVELDADVASMSSASEYSSHMSLEGSSPDSDTHDNLPTSSTAAMRRTGDTAIKHINSGGLHFRIIPSTN